jgi:uncharacterized membrane protein
VCRRRLPRGVGDRGPARPLNRSVTVLARSFVANLLFAALAVVAVATVIGLITLWPHERTVEPPAGLSKPETHAAEVISVAATPCRTPQARDCRRVGVLLRSGPDEGETAAFTVGDQGDEVPLTVGDRVRVYRNVLPPEAVIGGVQVDPYGLADFERRLPLALLFVAFALLVAITGRWRGMRALVGLLGSLGVVIVFVVPAILDGRPPLSVALVGAFAIMLITIPLAHGMGAKSVAAMLGTAASLILVVLLARIATEFTRLTGISSEEAVFLRATAGDLSVQGLFLAGMVIGALGVLDDTTVTQSSTVMALRRADPTQNFRELFQAAITVGHDHIAATVNTLVLAYAGASLPVLLIFSLGDTSFSEAINNEAVAEEIVAMLVGSMGLIAAVPVTTALAALLATRLSPRAVGGGHEHVHAH